MPEAPGYIPTLKDMLIGWGISSTTDLLTTALTSDLYNEKTSSVIGFGAGAAAAYFVLGERIVERSLAFAQKEGKVNHTAIYVPSIAYAVSGSTLGFTGGLVYGLEIPTACLIGGLAAGAISLAINKYRLAAAFRAHNRSI